MAALICLFNGVVEGKLVATDTPLKDELRAEWVNGEM